MFTKKQKRASRAMMADRSMSKNLKRYGNRTAQMAEVAVTPSFGAILTRALNVMRRKSTSRSA